MDITASKTGADVDTLTIRCVHTGIDNYISALRRGGGLMVTSTSKLVAHMHILSIRPVQAGIDNLTSGIGLMVTSTLRIGADMDILSIGCLQAGRNAFLPKNKQNQS